MDPVTRTKIQAVVKFSRLKAVKEKRARRESEEQAAPSSRDLSAPLLVSAPHAPKSDLMAAYRLVLSNPINLLLLVLPVALYSGVQRESKNVSPGIVFATNFLSLVPLAFLLSNLTEDLAIRFGDVIGGLLSASFGNVVEVILALAALSKGLFELVATSLLGSILSNLLLVLGASFMAGGFKFHEQQYSTTAIRTYSSLLLLVLVGFGIPSAYATTVYGGDFDILNPPPEILKMSRAIAASLLIAYCAYLYFQLGSHRDLFLSINSSTSDLDPPSSSLAPPAPGHPPRGEDPAVVLETVTVQHVGLNEAPEPASRPAVDLTSGPPSPLDDLDLDTAKPEPEFSLLFAMLLLGGISVLVAACSEFLTGSVEGVTRDFHLSQAFLGFILLPIAGNAAEHATAVIVAAKGKIDLAVAVALGSSIQIALFAIPLMVMLAIPLNKPFSLAFDPFSVIIVILSVLHTQVSLDGRANWLLGFMLMTAYNAIAVAFFWGKF